jgi:hypothetical protein
MSKVTANNLHTKRKPPRTKKEREEHLAKIAYADRLNPVKSMNIELFAEKIADELGITVGTAKKDILEVKRRRKKAAEIDQQYELGKKLEELAAVKEMAIKSQNINAYLGAINKECELLGLDKFSIFVGTQEDMELSLALKKKVITDKLTIADNSTPSKEPEAPLAQDRESQGTDTPQKENA